MGCIYMTMILEPKLILSTYIALLGLVIILFVLYEIFSKYYSFKIHKQFERFQLLTSKQKDDKITYPNFDNIKEKIDIDKLKKFVGKFDKDTHDEALLYLASKDYDKAIKLSTDIEEKLTKKN